MCFTKVIFFAVALNLISAFTQAQEMSHDPEETVQTIGAAINAQTLNSLSVHDRGRIKPFQTLTRETSMFLTGKYSFFGLNSVQLYLALIVSPDSEKLELINLRDTSLRVQLGFPKSKRYFSAAELEKSPLFSLAEPLREKEEMNSRSLSPEEKHIMEAYSQYWFFKQVRSAEHFLNAIDFSSLGQKDDGMAAHGGANTALDKAKEFLNTVSTLDREKINSLAVELKSIAAAQPVPEILQAQMHKLDLEVFYNNSKLFFISAILFLLIGISLFFPRAVTVLQHKAVRMVFALPIIILGFGFALRVYITGFAPVTNMYGTMIWVSFGVSIFSLVLLAFYRNFVLVGCLWIGAALVLLLTESIPIILSPDLDPIVAVLRSNLWLTIHVLTIVISYAAFTITMILSNVVLVRSILYGIDNDETVKNFSHSIYRMIQLGVFLLSVGIILGGVWADYSWGRFWGWDPKETWALIADVGFIAILHARFIGWLKPFGIIMAAPVAYLLVIMAWYGVNFILAAGLHSYGFSSGGATVVLTFVIIQFAILGTAVALRYARMRSLIK